MITAPVQRLFYMLALAVLIVWILYVTQDVVIPIVVALVIFYVLQMAERALARLGHLRRVPRWIRQVLVLALFTAAMVALAVAVVASAQDIANSLPRYQENLERMLANLAARAGFAETPSWASLRAVTIDQIDIQGVALSAAGSIFGFGGALVLVIVYTAFMVTEAEVFRKKFVIAMGREAENSLDLVAQINARIGEYLAVKTLINVILAAISLVIMLAIGVEFAVFWALLIGLMNYVPYVGSLAGVLFPVLLALAQFATPAPVLATALLLGAGQFVVGNYLEPWMIGRRVNLSPLVVLVSLLVWTALWGVPGAVLAVPLTSVSVIILRSNPATWPVAVLLTADGDV